MNYCYCCTFPVISFNWAVLIVFEYHIRVFSKSFWPGDVDVLERELGWTKGWLLNTWLVLNDFFMIIGPFLEPLCLVGAKISVGIWNVFC